MEVIDNFEIKNIKNSGNKGSGSDDLRILNIEKGMPALFKRNYMRRMDYNDNELLSLLKQYYDEYKKIPSLINIKENPKYPSHNTYVNHFGSWSNALKLAGLDADTIIKEGKIPSSFHKGRLAEMLVFNSFKDKTKASDLSGINCNSIFDGICPRGKNYDVKSSALIYNKKYINSGGWAFHFRNKEIEQIDYFYLVAVNEDYTKLIYIWLIPRKDFTYIKDTLYISIKKLHDYDKYLIDLNKCNLNNLSIESKEESL